MKNESFNDLIANVIYSLPEPKIVTNFGRKEFRQ